MRHWHLRALTLQQGKRLKVFEDEGQSPQSLWETIIARQIDRRPLWVFGYDLSSTLTLADFWGSLERKVFTVGPIKPKKGETRLFGKKIWNGMLCVERSPVFATVMSASGKIQFTDVLNYCPAGLEEIADSLGRASPRSPQVDEPSDYLEVYDAGVCSLIEDYMVALLLAWKRNDGGPWGKTVASMALNSYRRFCGTQEGRKLSRPLITARHQEAESLERSAYYGGRVDPVRLGKCGGEFFKLDISSAYPAAMLANVFPRCRKGILKNPTPSELLRKTVFDGASAVVDIVSPDDVYPVQLDKVLGFCKGSFTTALCGAELRHALEKGHVRKVYDSVIYDCAPLFAGWVERWYRLKCEASARGRMGFADRLVAKMVLNSLYGKFAQHGAYWKTFPGGQLNGDKYGAWLDTKSDGRIIECRAIAGVRQERVNGEPPRHYFPAISAFITAAAREYLRTLVNICPERSLYYIGVDMLIVDRDGMEALHAAGMIGQNELGKLEVKEAANEVEIVSPNWYRFGSKWTRSGGWGIAFQGSDREWYYEATERLPTILATTPDGTVATHTHALGIHQRWAKGSVDASGWVTPYTLNEYRSLKLTQQQLGG